MKPLRVFSKRSLSLLLSFIMIISLFVVIPVEFKAASEITYIERHWDEASDSVVDTTCYRSSYTNIANRSSDTLTR